MNKLETLAKEIAVIDKVYVPQVYLTAWRRWCIAYVNIIDPHDRLCSVVVESENEPIEIEESINYLMNAGVGNARNIDDAIDMINNYIKILNV